MKFMFICRGLCNYGEETTQYSLIKFTTDITVKPLNTRCTRRMFEKFWKPIPLLTKNILTLGFFKNLLLLSTPFAQHPTITLATSKKFLWKRSPSSLVKNHNNESYLNTVVGPIIGLKNTVKLYKCVLGVIIMNPDEISNPFLSERL